ncbi:MAG: methylmalonyl Co-A mutase-associated GTPase MeaB [Candidatus Manganitrophaceae bacterium]
MAASIRQILKGETRSVSRLLTHIENRDASIRPLLKALFPYTGKARLIAVTGPAGAGKSTLVSQLITAFRGKRKSVGVLAVDPSSPFTGGAILGDRLRMQTHFLDREVFIRSLATRGTWGGISPALFDAIHLLDASGKDVILIETVGVGQDEVAIARLTDLVLLVLAPGIGDDVQLMKAGLLEIGDIVVVNKGDLRESQSFYRQLKEALSPRPILKVTAEKGKGIHDLISLLEKQLPSPIFEREKQIGFIREELRTLLREAYGRAISEVFFEESAIEAILNRRRDPYAVIDAWLRRQKLMPSFSTP